MEMTIEKIQLRKLINKQLSTFFCDSLDVYPYLESALLRTEKCFKRNKNKYYKSNNGNVLFSPFHSGQYSIFLYILSNTIYKESTDVDLAAKIYYLNKILHSVDLYYEIELPEYWGVEHPLGSVLGRAKYGEGLFIYQGCTVGGNNKIYPKIGKNVILYSNSTVLGDSEIGDNVLVSTGATIKDEDIPSDSIVFGQSPNLVIKRRKSEDIQRYICDFWEVK